MQIDNAIAARLLSWPGLTALVGNRVYGGQAEQSAQAPYVVFFAPTRLREDQGFGVDGDGGNVRSIYQFDAWANSRREAGDVVEQVMLALRRWSQPGPPEVSGSLITAGPLDGDFEIRPQLNRQYLQVTIYYRE